MSILKILFNISKSTIYKHSFKWKFKPLKYKFTSKDKQINKINKLNKQNK